MDFYIDRQPGLSCTFRFPALDQVARLAHQSDGYTLRLEGGTIPAPFDVCIGASLEEVDGLLYFTYGTPLGFLAALDGKFDL